jgi:general L-amino acid transport system substrate-binding protein
MFIKIKSSFSRLAATACVLAGATIAAQAATLDDVRKRGTLHCGVSQGLPGFSDRDAKGVWNGFDVDFCKAVAAAVLGDASKVNYVPLSASERFEALRAGKIDLLSRNSTWTLEREATLGLLFAGITYHDGQGFLVLRRPQVISALELNDTSVCVQAGTTSQANLGDFMRANSMAYKELVFPTLVEAMKALESGQCDVFTADQSALFAERVKLSNPSAAVILPDVISKEPLGPVTRADDVRWFNIVRWVNYALVNAEELGISTTTIAEASASQKPAVRRFTGAQGNLGQALGLDNAWALKAVQAVGNYAEVFERNIGSQSRLGIPRGLNQLWSTGGILYAPPLQ